MMCELALELGMTYDELGRRASNYEMCVIWPVFLQERQRVREIQELQQQSETDRKRRGM